MKSNPKQNDLSWEEIFHISNENELIAHKASVLGSQFMHFVDKAATNQGLSRKALALKVNTSASYITQLMRGDKLPNMEILARFCNALQFDFVIATNMPDGYESDQNEVFNLQALELRKNRGVCKVFEMRQGKGTGNIYEEQENLLISSHLHHADKAIPA